MMTCPHALKLLAIKRDHGRGFTLLEVLVVLIIVSLISVVLMQGLGMVLGLRDNFGNQMVELDRVAVKRNMVMHPLQGLVPDFNDGENQFLGNAVEVKGLTIQPLLRRSGRPIPFSMTLQYDESSRTNTLLYREDQDPPLELSAWQGPMARFKYIGETDGGWAEMWPPPLTMPQNVGMITELAAPQLPQLIYLATESLDEVDYAVAVQTRRNRVSRDPPPFGGAGGS